MDVLLENENSAQLVVVAKSLAARERLQRSAGCGACRRNFSDIITRVSPLELGPPVGWPIKYRVSGPDYLQVRALANRLTDAIGRSPLTRDVNQTAGEPERVITLAGESDGGPGGGRVVRALIAQHAEYGLVRQRCHHGTG